MSFRDTFFVFVQDQFLISATKKCFFFFLLEFVTLRCESKISVGAKLPSWMECDVWHTSLTKPNCPNILGANALRGNIASSIFHCSTQTNCPHSALKHFWPTLLSIEEARRALLAQAGWCWWWSRTHSSSTFSTPWVFLSILHNRTSAHH